MKTIYNEEMEKHVCENCHMRWWTLEDSSVKSHYCPHCGEKHPYEHK